jgi:ATPase
VDYIPDTSVIVDGRFTKFIGKLTEGSRIIFSEAMLSEIEHQANQKRSTGFAALDELRKIKTICTKKDFDVEFIGKRPSQWQIVNGHNGEIDDMIRSLALEFNGVLVTGDIVQRNIAMLKGIQCEYLEPKDKDSIKIEEFFGADTTSVHIKAENYVKTKNGKPGEVKMIRTERFLKLDDVESLINNLIKRAGNEKDSFIEIDTAGVTVIQLNIYRIVIARPPFANTPEITIVRPVTKKSLDYYEIPDLILKHILSGSAGILVAGSPGAGKSTFVQALADFLNDEGMIVKTMEKPRDLQVNREITQYTSLDGSMEKTGDILLLVRNDYTIFDEMRVTSDFKVFSDLRLAGVGMVGVVHATTPIDGLHRFIGRIELGLITQVIDTILYIKDGKISRYLTISHSVKVPHGMVQEDLARPVIQVKDGITSEELFEIYSFGEQIVVIPVGSEERESVDSEMLEKVREKISSYLGTDQVKVSPKNRRRVKVTIPESLRAKLLGRKGANIGDIEKSLGISIDVISEEDKERKEVGIEIKNRIIYLYCNEKNSLVNIYADDLMILQGRTSSKGIIRIKVDSETGINIEKSLKGKKILSYSTQRE